MIILLVALFALFMRLITINQSFWLDETIQANVSHGSLQSIIEFSRYDFHPPFFYILTHFWILFSDSDIWLRFFSIICGVSTVILLYFIVRIYRDKKVSLLSSFLLSISQLHIYYSQEFRMYAFVTFLSVLSMYLFLRQIKNHTKRGLTLLSIVNALILYSNYVAALLLVVQLICIILLFKKDIKKYLLSSGISILLWIPWIPFFIRQLQYGISPDSILPGWSQILSYQQFYSLPLMLFKFIFGRISIDDNILYSLVIFFVLIISAYPLFKVFRKYDVFSLFCALWFLVPFVIVYIISFKIPMFQPFRLLFVLPALFILIADGIDKSGRFKKYITFLFILILLAGNLFYFFDKNNQREDWKAVISELQASSNIPVVVSWNKPLDPLIWYEAPQQIIAPITTFPAEGDMVNERLEELSGQSQLFYVNYLHDLSDPQNKIEMWFEENSYTITKEKSITNIGSLYLYEKKN